MNDTYTFDQDLQIVFQYPAGDPVPYDIGTHHFTWKKIDTTHWTISFN